MTVFIDKERLDKLVLFVPLPGHGKATVKRSTGITFCDIIDPEDQLGGLVDRHPNKRGKYIPSTGLPVIGPDQLDPTAVDTVVVMNPLDTNAIQSDLRQAGISAQVVNV